MDWSCLSCYAFNKHSYTQSVINTNVGSNAIMKVYFFPIVFLLLTTCTQVTSDSLNTTDSASLKTDSLTTDKLEMTSILGDTITQRLEFEVNDDTFEFEIVYIIKEPYELSLSYQKEIVEFKPISLPSSFSKTMINKLKEDFRLFYYIPIDNFNNAIQSRITDKHISEFFKINDYNLDGISDIGISDTPTGNNVFEDIFVKLDNEFVFWKGLSGRPIWTVNQDQRTITTGWHKSADVYSVSTLQITSDTTLTELSREETEELNETRLIKKTYKLSRLTKVDTLNRNSD